MRRQIKVSEQAYRHILSLSEQNNTSIADTIDNILFKAEDNKNDIQRQNDRCIFNYYDVEPDSREKDYTCPILQKNIVSAKELANVFCKVCVRRLKVLHLFKHKLKYPTPFTSKRTSEPKQEVLFYELYCKDCKELTNITEKIDHCPRCYSKAIELTEVKG